MKDWLRSFFGSNKQDTIDKPLIVVDVGDTLGSMHEGLNRPLYDRLAYYRENGAEVIIASDGSPNIVNMFKEFLDLEGMDPAIFTATLTPAHNGFMTKESRRFWPSLLTHFQRDARQVLLIDDRVDLLHKAQKHKVGTFQITTIPSSEDTLCALDKHVAALGMTLS